MKKLKKITSLILSASMILGACSVVNAKDYSWDDINTKTGVYITADGVSMLWSPIDGYVSRQNPPDFTWPYVNGAVSYDFRICTRPVHNDSKVYEKAGLTNNYHNLQNVLETGTQYYWFVRYNKADGSSSWSEPRKFRIDPDAHIFTVNDWDEVFGKIPSSHPRIFTTNESGTDYYYTLDEFKSIKDNTATGKSIFDHYFKQAKRYADANSIPDDPVDMEQKKADSVARGLNTQIVACSFSALIAEDSPERDKIVNHCIKALRAIATWNPKGMTSHKANDQVNREIMYKCAMAYDWLYHDLSADDRKAITDMLKTRWDIMGDFADKITKNPLDSHGWTILGYQGIVSYALCDDVPWAREKFQEILPLYTAVLPPWSTQDGGWSQGTGYWKHGTNSNKEFIDVIQLSGLVSLYDKAWLQNEPIWLLYTNAVGSYGSFGDEGNTYVVETNPNTRQSMARHMFFNQSSLAARLANDQGGQNKSYLYNYYTAPAEDMEEDKNLIYPRGHHMQDLDWAIMSSDLADPGRVQFTFKSSSYGSYNHSHSDQNAFIIQAFGENLAVRSGYYDYYGEDHHVAITNASHSHNTITVDGGKGQAKDSFSAKGEINQFATHLSFDSVTASAADAYVGTNPDLFGGAFAGRLDKFDRSIIYIRPDVFIVVDDLKATEGNTSSFEWWLNGPTDNIDTDSVNKTAHIQNGNAHLMARAVYPQNITVSQVYDGYINPADGKEYLPMDEHEERMSRMNFATDKVADTVMVVAMNVYEDGTAEKEPTVNRTSDYIKLTYPDGTKVVVNTGSPDASITVDGFRFTGRAIVYNKNSVMLVNGNYLGEDSAILVNSTDEDYTILVSSIEPVTAAMGLGQLSMSTAKETTVEIMYPNKYVDIEDVKNFEDYLGRSLNSDIGISDITDTGFSSMAITVEPGDYNLLDSSYGIFTPSQLIPKKLSLQKTDEGKVAAYWDEHSFRSYDITINGKTVKNVTSPYVFDLPSGEAVTDVYLTERVEDISGSSSDAVYVASYDKDLRDNIQIYENGNNVKASTRVFPDGNTNLYLATYASDGTLAQIKKAETKEGDYTSVTLTKPSGGSARAFLVANNIKPLASDANLGQDNTNLSYININGALVEGFAPEKDYYEVLFEKNSEVFPYITAKAEDSSAKVDIDYNFADLSAKITVTGQKGTQRVIAVDFSHKMDNIHFVAGAIDTETQFKVDTTVGVNAKGENSLVSRSNVATLSYKSNGSAKTTRLKLYTDMRGNAGEGTTGSHSLSDRDSTTGNHHEVSVCPGYLEGFDYFALPLKDYYSLFDKNEITDTELTFELSAPAEVAILSVDKIPSLLVNKEYNYQSAEGEYRYMGFIVGPEDVYYNKLVGCPVELTVNSYLNDYAHFDVVANVLPLDGFKTLEDYNTDAPTADRFEGDSKSGYATKKYSHMYTKDYGAGTVTVNLNDLSHSGDRVVIVVKPITPKPFEYKLK